MSPVMASTGPVFAGIDIGGTSIKWMIVDEAGAIATQGNERTDREAVAPQVGRIGARLAGSSRDWSVSALSAPASLMRRRGPLSTQRTWSCAELSSRVLSKMLRACLPPSCMMGGPLAWPKDC